MKTCPHCSLTNPDSATKCDCGYRWDYRGESPSPLLPPTVVADRAGVRVVAIGLGVTDWFWVFLKALVALWLVALLLALPYYLMAAGFLALVIHGGK